MKKIIIKTTVISLIIILIAISLFFGSVAIFKPSIMANIALNSGNEKVCVKYTEKQYMKSGDVQDLTLLAERSIWAKDYGRAEKYITKLILNDNFYLIESTKESGYKNYLASSLVEAIYLNGKSEKALQTALNYYDGVSVPNTMRVIIYLFSSKNDKAWLETTYNALNSLDTKTEETLYLLEQIHTKLN